VDRAPSGQDALIYALSSGINLIDTSSNYGDGESERLIGKTLSKLIDDAVVKRDEIVISTKAGYVQGKTLELAKERIQDGNPFPEMEQLYEDADVWYCMSPAFLESQITTSLTNMGLDTIDFFLIHNPEHYYDVYQRVGAFDREFYNRIERAFTYLESEVKRGRIQHYGVSSNTLASTETDDNSISLGFLLNVAQQVSPNHNFSVVQFPMNLFEHDAYTFKNTSTGSHSVCSLAKSAGLITLPNRPLNAFVDRRLLFRLAKPFHQKPASHESLTDDIKAALNDAIHHERSYPGTDPKHPLTIDGQLPSAENLSWAQILACNAQQLDLFNFLNFKEYQLQPQLSQTLQRLDHIEGMLEWTLGYQKHLKLVLDLFEELLRLNRDHEVQQFEERLVTALPLLSQNENLVQKSLQVLLLTGVDSALMGMHRHEYVNDALKVLEQNSPEKKVEPYLLENLFDFTTDQAKFIQNRYTNPNEVRNTPF